MRLVLFGSGPGSSRMKILTYPHPALRVKTRPVLIIDTVVHKAAADMLALMYKNEGLGLAAPQVGLDFQLLVMNFAGDASKPEMEVVALNPVIVEMKGELVNDREGCLSFPGLYQNVRRHKTVKVEYYTLRGEKMSMTCHDLSARVWQHEIDHLHGTLFIDKMGSLGRERSQRELDKFIADFEKAKKRGELPVGLQAKL